MPSLSFYFFYFFYTDCSVTDFFSFSFSFSFSSSFFLCSLSAANFCIIFYIYFFYLYFLFLRYSYVSSSDDVLSELSLMNKFNWLLSRSTCVISIFCFEDRPLSKLSNFFFRRYSRSFNLL